MKQIYIYICIYVYTCIGQVSTVIYLSIYICKYISTKSYLLLGLQDIIHFLLWPILIWIFKLCLQKKVLFHFHLTFVIVIASAELLSELNNTFIKLTSIYEICCILNAPY